MRYWALAAATALASTAIPAMGEQDVTKFTVGAIITFPPAGKTIEHKRYCGCYDLENKIPRRQSVSPLKVLNRVVTLWMQNPSAVF